ncbi:MAG TPA: MaoC/PaaZ C-terminal domain-containing protein [Solirubrobacteraceae bacterium]|jgi:acyl dehydratase|nr:MaoC/PaaZ C-terminal domain-containing protein [Solirubrobacteraceae bacterium]
MGTRTLSSPPRVLPLYARTVAPLVPGASRLPWVGGGGGEIPDTVLSLPQARAEPGRVAAYAAVCGFEPSERLPASYPHVLAFPLHLALMADGRFPFAAVGLVHVANTIAQQRPIDPRERLELKVRATPLRPHPRGRVFSLVSEARVEGELVWCERSTMLRRDAASAAAGKGAASAGEGAASEPGAPPRDAAGAEQEQELQAPGETGETEQWSLAGDLGRRYAAVSGDRNPIHMHALTARPLGFPRAIAHGMWTKARCLAALSRGPFAATLAGPFSVEVRFRRPILLPAQVAFASAPAARLDGVAGTAASFGVRDAREHTEHLVGRMQPITDVTSALEASR